MPQSQVSTHQDGYEFGCSNSTLDTLEGARKGLRRFAYDMSWVTLGESEGPKEARKYRCCSWWSLLVEDILNTWWKKFGLITCFWWIFLNQRNGGWLVLFEKGCLRGWNLVGCKPSLQVVDVIPCDMFLRDFTVNAFACCTTCGYNYNKYRKYLYGLYVYIYIYTYYTIHTFFSRNSRQTHLLLLNLTVHILTHQQFPSCHQPVQVAETEVLQYTP